MLTSPIDSALVLRHKLELMDSPPLVSVGRVSVEGTHKYVSCGLESPYLGLADEIKYEKRKKAEGETNYAKGSQRLLVCKPKTAAHGHYRTKKTAWAPSPASPSNRRINTASAGPPNCPRSPALAPLTVPGPARAEPSSFPTPVRFKYRIEFEIQIIVQ
ncbi:hypothetical protein EVAR_41033_1 [Eumeta japonica]|uniref:Uncharacterized protein n=1 Tax=Eumeta variegata TaxID=151549 RepID=A0A4C1Z341_EUMVA|nr:hypothetical protein EVAR_41033_1 [Eumeta japonica]